MRNGACSMVAVSNNPFSDEQEECRAIGAVLRESMIRHGIGITEVAAALGIRRQHLYQIQRGDRRLYAEHVPKLPEPVRDDVMRELLERWGKTLADKIPGDTRGLRDAAQDLVIVSGELVGIVRKLAGRRHVTAGEVARSVEDIGLRVQKIGASLIQWSRTLQRERVVGLEDE